MSMAKKKRALADTADVILSHKEDSVGNCVITANDMRMKTNIQE
jgi:hypothetical protein